MSINFAQFEPPYRISYLLDNLVGSLDWTLSELSTGRMDPRVGSGRVTILPDFGGSGRVSTSDFLVFY